MAAVSSGAHDRARRAPAGGAGGARLLTSGWRQAGGRLRRVRTARVVTKEPAMLKPNVPAWFEIPTSDLDRAQRFYEAILAQPLQRTAFAGADIAVFPRGDKPNATGALIRLDELHPTVQGSIVYLSVDDLRPVLDRAE